MNIFIIGSIYLVTSFASGTTSGSKMFVAVNFTLENIYMSGCTGDHILLQCPSNHRIAINRLFYGVKRSWECQQVPRKASCCYHSHSDCMINVEGDYSVVNTQCSGYRNCEILVKRTPVWDHCPPASYTDHMTVIYDCVPDKDVVHFCSNDIKRGHSLYLANNDYPSTLEAQREDCTCMVRTKSGAVGINVYSIDVLLAWPSQGKRRLCSKELSITDGDGYRWNIQCGHVGYYGFRTIYTKPVQNVTLSLKSSASVGSAFVWLQTKATNDEEELEILCGKALEKLLLRFGNKKRHKNITSFKSDHTTSPEMTLNNATLHYRSFIGSLTSHLVTIIGSIAGVGILFVSMATIAVVLRCKKTQLVKQRKKLTASLYPPVTDNDVSNGINYGDHVEDGDDRYSTIRRSFFKVVDTQDDLDKKLIRSKVNNFITLGMSEQNSNAGRTKQKINSNSSLEITSFGVPKNENSDAFVQKSDNYQPILFSSSGSTDKSSKPEFLAIPIQHPFTCPGLPENDKNNFTCKSDNYKGINNQRDISYGCRDMNCDSHKLLNKYGMHLTAVHKSPFSKRGKNVSFSQPIAKVTPLPSGYEESMISDGEPVFALVGSLLSQGEKFTPSNVSFQGKQLPIEGNYDNLDTFVSHEIKNESQFHGSLQLKQDCRDFLSLPSKGCCYRYIEEPDIDNNLGNVLNSSLSLPRNINLHDKCGTSDIQGSNILTQLQYPDDKQYGEDRNLSFPSPPPSIIDNDTFGVVHNCLIPIPIIHTMPQKAELYETGI